MRLLLVLLSTVSWSLGCQSCMCNYQCIKGPGNVEYVSGSGCGIDGPGAAKADAGEKCVGGTLSSPVDDCACSLNLACTGFSRQASLLTPTPDLQIATSANR